MESFPLRGPRTKSLHGVIAATGLSNVGDWLTTVALTVALYSQLGSIGPAAYVLARVVPRPLGAAMSGRAAFHLGARRAWALLSAGQAGVAGAILAALASRQAWIALVFVAASQALGAAAIPVRVAALSGFASDPAERKRLFAAQATVANAAMLIAPPIGGALLLVVGASVVVALDGLTFLAVALAVGMVSSPSGVTPLSAPRCDHAGPGIALRCRPILPYMATGFISAIVITALQGVIVVVAQRRFGSANLAGAFYAAVGVGSVAAGIASRSRLSLGAHIPSLGALEVAGAVVFVLAPSVAAAAVALTVCGAAGTAMHIAGTSLMADSVEPGALPAVAAGASALAFTGMAVGSTACIAASGVDTGVFIFALGAAALVLIGTVGFVNSRSSLRDASVTLPEPVGNEVLRPTLISAG